MAPEKAVKRIERLRATVASNRPISDHARASVVAALELLAIYLIRSYDERLEGATRGGYWARRQLEILHILRVEHRLLRKEAAWVVRKMYGSHLPRDRDEDAILRSYDNAKKAGVFHFVSGSGAAHSAAEALRVLPSRGKKGNN